MNAAVLNTSNSRMYLIVPIAEKFGGTTGGAHGGALVPTEVGESFEKIDPDVHLPAWFFGTLQRRKVVVDGGDVHLDEDGFHISVGGADVIGVGAGDSEAWFAVVDLADREGDLEQWLEVARRSTKAR